MISDLGHVETWDNWYSTAMKVSLHVMFLARVSNVIRMTDRMGLSSILSIIHTVTIGAILNNNGGNDGHGLKNFTCKLTPSGGRLSG